MGSSQHKSHHIKLEPLGEWWDQSITTDEKYAVWLHARTYVHSHDSDGTLRDEMREHMYIHMIQTVPCVMKCENICTFTWFRRYPAWWHARTYVHSHDSDSTLCDDMREHMYIHIIHTVPCVMTCENICTFTWFRQYPAWWNARTYVHSHDSDSTLCDEMREHKIMYIPGGCSKVPPFGLRNLFLTF